MSSHLVCSSTVYSFLPARRRNQSSPANFSYLLSLKSVFSIHNETINIWSHIIAALGFLIAICFLCTSLPLFKTRETTADFFAIFIYCNCVIVCFAFSFMSVANHILSCNSMADSNSSFHIFLDHSHLVRKITCGFDYLGIIIPLWGTTVTSAHFGFRAEPVLQSAYVVVASVPAVLCAIATLHPIFSGPSGRKIRTGAYLMLGLSSFLPITHGIMLHGAREHSKRMSLVYYLGLGLCQGTGIALYATRVPERWYPQRFDLYGSSHQLMHILVVCGAVCYGLGILRAEAYWRGLVPITHDSLSFHHSS